MFLEVGEGVRVKPALLSKIALRSRVCLPDHASMVGSRPHRVNVVHSMFDDWNIIILPSICILLACQNAVIQLVKIPHCHSVRPKTFTMLILQLSPLLLRPRSWHPPT